MINHDNLDCVLSPIINNYISGRIQTTIVQNYTFIILSKYGNVFQLQYKIRNYIKYD